jgi:hypothetical protein
MGGFGMAGRYQGYHFIHERNVEGYLGFEVFWRQGGWYWRPMLKLDAKAVGPFTKSTEAYQNALASKPAVRTSRAAS